MKLIKVNQLNVAEDALLETQTNHEFEVWMKDHSIFETFFHEAFKRNAADFMENLLKNLPKNFIEDVLLPSDNYIQYATEWLEKSDRKTDRYRKRSLIFC